jgi:hypothetical protein
MFSWVKAVDWLAFTSQFTRRLNPKEHLQIRHLREKLKSRIRYSVYSHVILPPATSVFLGCS